ncbi:hypothetical protein FZI95_20595 [Mycobacterium sp. CBMA247]|nr:hypothetical protein [Mycolicibacterium sp. CBMA 329]MUL88566.1 hypothetical protein [Mycolicibacterium sp. CBMA 331]MUM00094.1 hypothetical protein [Mycolicibacterium sp. CBMA 334]MUM40213.1 hypothetical protein [Mycolicibacterium sp. CBMA 247]MUM44630.1 hypothetical protein [Mycolicibacterium sp. CBMA 294]
MGCQPSGTACGRRLRRRPHRLAHRRRVIPRLARPLPLQELVAEIPAPLVAEMLGCNDKVTQRHAEAAGTTWSKCVT